MLQDISEAQPIKRASNLKVNGYFKHRCFTSSAKKLGKRDICHSLILRCTPQLLSSNRRVNRTF